ncbi:MAG: hypothetical protein LUG18_15830 [Candidatus Azobacteroides sp.]|nr:hypothetical protein [Candidatus Azobacteroides sp.]
MKKTIFSLMIFVASLSGSHAQQIGTGSTTSITNFNTVIPTGMYHTDKAQVNYPNEVTAWPLKHLINLRNASNLFQISSAYTHDDRLFFRKVVVNSTNPNGNNEWFELATRKTNFFKENQHIAANKSLYLGHEGEAARRIKISFVSGTTNGDSYIDYGGKLYFRPAGKTESLIAFDAGGNVSIGFSSSPDNKRKLTVNGTITANEIQVKTNVWADFVFDPSYKLPPLKDVKLHIGENRHLPGIPTESEVLENGINLSDMTVKLLQKVEELTLYAIQQQETIEKQQEFMLQQAQNIHLLYEEIKELKDMKDNKETK